MVWTFDFDDFTGTVCGNNVKYPLIGAIREELHGISRGVNTKDVDWSSLGSTISESFKTEPYEIPTSEVTAKVTKVSKPTINFKRKFRFICGLS